MTAPRVSDDPQDPQDPQSRPGPHDPQGPQDPHLDAGAYVLGLLDEADRTAFRAHLAGCPRCADEVGSLGALEPLLAEYAAGLPELDPLPEPGPRLLDGLLAQVARTRRRTRTRRLALACAAAALIIGGPAVTAAVLADGPPPAAQAAVLHSATDPSGVSATVGVTDQGWGSAVTLRLDGVSGPRDCDLVAVSAQGARQTVTSWNIAATGYGSQPAKELRTSGGAGFHPADINHFEVRDLATGGLLISIPANS